MTTTIRSGEMPFPNPPRVSMELGDGWVPLAEPTAVVAGALAEWQGFRPNVCVTVKRLEGRPELVDVARDAWGAFSAGEEFADAGNGLEQGLGDRECFAMEGAFIVPGVGTVYQVSWLTLVAQGDVTDAVLVSGSADASAAAELVPVIREIIGSVRIAADGESAPVEAD
jgi:hypothetical protein